MSGVYIKGMEMPTSCRACPMKMNCDDCEGWECVCVPLHQQIGYLDDLLTDKRRDDCPLVHVPPHGRLIDADALIKVLKARTANPLNQETRPYSWSFAYECLADVAGDMPTILEAEEGE